MGKGFFQSIIRIATSYKQPDFHWSIPDVVFQQQECKRGFLQGIFDVEGTVDEHTPSIRLTSKHRENLFPLISILQEFKVGSYLYTGKTSSGLRIPNRTNCISFQKYIGFRYKPKSDALAKLCTVQYTQETYYDAKKLHTGGLSYAEIARQVGVKDGWTIKEWITGIKTPYAVKYNW